MLNAGNGWVAGGCWDHSWMISPSLGGRVVFVGSQEFYHLLVSLLDYCVGRLPASMVKPGPSGGSVFFRMAGVGGCFFELINGYKLWL